MINFDANKLLIIDALYKQGSNKMYKNNDHYLYSEHSGVIKIKNGEIDKIVVLTNNYLNINDNEIFLPKNNSIMKQYPLLFHTHPNTNGFSGRIKNGVLYEFPSPNDINNFIKYHNTGNVIASLVISPEGIYVIRNLNNVNFIDNNILRKIISENEIRAIKKFKNLYPNICHEELFYKNVAINYHAINKINNELKQYNIIIDYHPRIKLNENWILPEFKFLVN